MNGARSSIKRCQKRLWREENQGGGNRRDGGESALSICLHADMDSVSMPQVKQRGRFLEGVGINC